MKSLVTIRPPTMEDCHDFLSSVKRSRSLHKSWVKPPSNRVAFRLLVDRVASETHCPFLVMERETGALAGAIGIGHIIRGPLQSAFVGYYAFAGFEKRGLMHAGMKQVLVHAFTRLKLHRIEANIQPGNTASQHFVRALGFKQEGFSPRYLKVCGRWKDHERWALIVDDWRR